MTPGIKTSEGRLALLKVLVTSAIAICSCFGLAIPAWLRPDAPWVTIAALVVGGVVTVLYGSQRKGLKQTLALAEQTVGGTPVMAELGTLASALSSTAAPTVTNAAAPTAPAVPEPDNSSMGAGNYAPTGDATSSGG